MFIKQFICCVGEGIDPNLQPDDYSESYLHVAARYGHRDVVKLLLQVSLAKLKANVVE